MPDDVRQLPGLPPADPATKCTKVELRVTAAEKDRWMSAAIAEGYTFSEWTRTVLDQRARDANADLCERRRTLIGNLGASIAGVEDRIGREGRTWLHVELRRCRNFLSTLQEIAQ